MTAAGEVQPMPEEQARVYVRRYKEARDYGLTRIEARMFAEMSADIGWLRKLRDLGCPPALAAKILL